MLWVVAKHHSLPINWQDEFKLSFKKRYTVLKSSKIWYCTRMSHSNYYHQKVINKQNNFYNRLKKRDNESKQKHVWFSYMNATTTINNSQANNN